MIGQMIAESLQISLRYAEMLATGIEAKDFGRLACVEGRPIDSNHPAWVYGHLCIYSPRVLDDLGVDSSAIQVPEKWQELFSPQGRCQDDPSGDLYPSKEVLVDQLLRGYRVVMETLAQTADEKFAEENRNERMRSRFSTVGAMHNFYTGGHFMIHMGQVSAWRRMMGLGSAM